MSQNYYETLVFGATFAGISIALHDPENTLVVESTALTGSEFVDSFNEKSCKNIDVKTPPGMDFKKRLIHKGLLSDSGEFYPAPTVYVLSGLIEERNAAILFLTVATEVSKKNDCYEVTLFNCDGFFKINAKNIIDTTSEGALKPMANAKNAEKTLNSILYCENSGSPFPFDSVTNPFCNLTVFRFPLKVQDDFTTARKKLNDFIQAHTEIFSAFKIILTANTFAYNIKCKSTVIDKNFIWLPGAFYDNLLQAFDEGLGGMNNALI